MIAWLKRWWVELLIYPAVLLLAVILFVLSGCDPIPHYKCVQGQLYRRDLPGEPYRAVDAAPSHAGFTPTPCVEDSK
jgi:hypothetical protein